MHYLQTTASRPPSIWVCSTWATTKYKFTPITTTVNSIETILLPLKLWKDNINDIDWQLQVTLNTHIPLTNSPIMAAHEVKAMVGIAAKGSCSDMTAFSMSFMLVKSSILLNIARQKVGIIAMQRVTSTRHQRGHCRFRNPSIEN